MGIPYVPYEENEDLDDPPSNVFKFGTSSSSGSKESSEVEFFTGIPVTPISLLSSNDIDSFEKARTVFLRAATRIEVAKKHYVLDGTNNSLIVLLKKLNHNWIFVFIGRFRD